MAAMLVTPAAGLVQVQQNGRLATRRAPGVSATSFTTCGARTRKNAVRGDSVCRIAAPKIRFVAEAR